MVSKARESPSHGSEPLSCESLGISVVVPTFKRVELCQTLLASLSDSRESLGNPVEVVVVDDSPPPEAHQIEKMCVEYGGRYYFKKLGVSGKRNFGASVASHPIVLFVDSDCEATPDLLREHLAAYAEHPGVVAVLGRTEFKGPESFAWKCVQFTSFLNAFHLADNETEVVWGPSNNLSCCRSTFLQIGGFDEAFTNKIGDEDIELGIRLHRQGASIITNPRALVYHTTETWGTFSQMVGRLFDYGRGEWHLYSSHRELLQFRGPNAVFLFLLAIPIALLSALVTSNLAWLALPAVFLALNLSTKFIKHIGHRPFRVMHPTRLVMAEFLGLIPEIGTTAECFRRRWFGPLFYRLIIHRDESRFTRTIHMIISWGPFVQLMISLVLVALVGFGA